MPIDRNKTGLTHRVTAVAAACLEGIGCKPVETEVGVRKGWIADVASYWYPTWTEMKKLHLHKRVRETLEIDDEIERDLIGPEPKYLIRCYGPGPFTVLVEVKTTAADFRGDGRKWAARPYPAHICFLAYPTGVMQPNDIPAGWFAIETSKEGRAVRKIHRSRGRLHPQHPGVVLDFVATVGIRRDHRTRYAAMRDWLKTYHAEEAEKRRRYSATRLLERVVLWLQGDGWKAERPLAEVLSDVGIQKVPHYLKESIAYLERIRDQKNSREAAEAKGE